MTKINETKVARRENLRKLMTERGDPLAVALGCADRWQWPWVVRTAGSGPGLCGRRPAGNLASRSGGCCDEMRKARR